MNVLILLPLQIVGAFLQAGVSTGPTLGWAKPPFLLTVALYAALRYDVRTTAWAAVGAGLLQDALDFVPLGVSSIGFLAIAFGSQMLRSYLFRGSGVTLLILVVLGTGLVTPWTWAVLYWELAEGAPSLLLSPIALLGKIGGQVMLAPLAVIILAPLGRLLERMLQPREEQAA